MEKGFNKCTFYFKVIILFLLLFTVFSKINAVSYDDGYVISKYYVEVVVNEDNTLNVTEAITAYFNEQKHGIIRKIPIRRLLRRKDGTTLSSVVKINDVKTSEECSVYDENGNKIIKIGNSNNTYTGAHTYVLKYTCSIGKDKVKGADELYYRLIEGQWDTKVGNISFLIKMPKSFDESSIGFSIGNSEYSSNNVEYKVNGNTIYGTVKTTLNPKEALAVGIDLPDGYFINSNNVDNDKYSVIVITICIIFVLIAYVIWSRFGKDDKFTYTISPYLPNEYNSAEANFLYNGVAEKEGVMSLLLYLANKGYLKLEEINLGNVRSFKITKLKEYTEDNEYEKMFFDGLFENVDVKELSTKEVNKLDENITKQSVTVCDLYNKFYTTVSGIIGKLNSTKDKIFVPSSKNKNKWFILMIIAIFVLITVKPALSDGTNIVIVLLFALLFPRI